MNKLLVVAVIVAALALWLRHAMVGAGTWSEADIPKIDGLRFLVTGGGTGLGLETIRVLTRRGAKEVIVTVRSADKCRATLQALGSPHNVRCEIADHSDLQSTAALVARLKNQTIDVLIANAGVMVPPPSTNNRGWEIQFATNHLGHYALIVGLLNDGTLRKGARVVVVSSSGAYLASLPLDFPQLPVLKEGWRASWSAYFTSKMSNLLFANALLKRRPDLTIVASHPGYTATSLQRSVGDSSAFHTLNSLVAMEVEIGALTQVRAAVDSASRDRVDWIGPSGLGELWGRPKKLDSMPAYAADVQAGDALWALSAKLTGVDLA